MLCTSSIGCARRTPAIRCSKRCGSSPSMSETSVEVPPMSKPIRRGRSSRSPTQRMPIRPPAGPDSTLDMAWKPAAAARPPLLCMSASVAPRGRACAPRQQCIDVVAQRRRQVGVEHGGIAARHVAHQRATARATPTPPRSPARARSAAAARSCCGGASRAATRWRPRAARRRGARASRARSRARSSGGQHLALRVDALARLDHVAYRRLGSRCGARRCPGGSGSRCAARRRSRRSSPAAPARRCASAGHWWPRWCRP